MIGYTLRHRVRFVRYTFFGALAFALDIALLYFLRDVALVPYYVAVPTAFFIATSLHYAALRAIVFHDTERLTGEGYAYFLFIMVTNALVVTVFVVGLVEFLSAHLYVARVAVGTVFGFISFFLNSRYNFRVL